MQEVLKKIQTQSQSLPMGHGQLLLTSQPPEDKHFCFHILSQNCPLTLAVADKPTAYLLPADFRSDIK